MSAELGTLNQAERFAGIIAAAARREHGTRARYVAGCKCVPCRAANSRYESERFRARTAGDWNGVVPADRARRHLMKLSGSGIGRRAVSDVSGVSATIIFKIKCGSRKQIRARTERAILSVGVDAVGPASLVEAEPTLKRIAWLKEEGFSQAEIARRIGLNTPNLQFIRPKNGKVTARTAMKIERLYNIHREGE